jgi:exonuclease VII large subunit
VVAWLAAQLRPDRSHHALDNYAGRLATHSERHEGLLRRGYVVGHHAIARVVTESAAITAGAPLDLEFYDGRVASSPAASRGRACVVRRSIRGKASLF